jgi:hypothetical protein
MTPTQGSVINNHFNISLADFQRFGNQAGLGAGFGATSVDRNQIDVSNSPKRHSTMILPSSPIESDDDYELEFENYFLFLQKKYENKPQVVEEFKHAKATLTSEHFDLKALREVSKEDLEKKNIKAGIALKIKRYIKDFLAIGI